MWWSSGEELDDPAALYGSEDVAVGQPAWYSIDGYSYGINDWRGNAENQRQRRPNDIPLDDVMPQTGNRSAVVIATTSTTTTTAAATTTASRLIELYRQAWAQRSMPVLHFLSGRKWVFRPAGATHCPYKREIKYKIEIYLKRTDPGIHQRNTKFRKNCSRDSAHGPLFCIASEMMHVDL